MRDYGRKLEFGISVIPGVAEYEGNLATVAAADESGLEFVGIQDHPYNSDFLDTWTLIAVLAARTKRIRFFPDVADLPLRPPAMLAKAAASLDVMTGGRVELGLGAGAFWRGIAAMGGPTRTPADAVAALEEAIAVVRAMWSAQRSVRLEGNYYSISGVHPGPAPWHRIEIWIGGYGPRMLGLTGRLADGWIPSMGYAPPQRLGGMHDRIDEAATEAGRNPSDVRRAYNISGAIGVPARGGLSGGASEWVEQLALLALEFGVDTFIYWPQGDPVHQIEVFANEVVAGARETVDKERNHSQRTEATGP